MALRVWLPLNGDLENKGISNYSINIFRGNEIYNNEGKIGKCFYSNGVNTIKILNIIPDFYNYTSYSLCAWFYIESQNTSHTGSAIISGGNWNNQVLNLAVSDWSTDHYTKLRISGTNWNTTYSYNFNKNTWYHVVVSSDGNKTYAYVNGILLGDTAVGFLPTSIEGNDICVGGATYYAGMQFFGRINDVRIYDHCLSAKEVKEISQGLVLHYKLDGLSGGTGDNLLWDTAFYDGVVITPTSDSYYDSNLRYYNTSASNLQIGNGEATILLNSTANLGFAFERFVHMQGSEYFSVETLELDPTSYYTLSCEAKTTMSGANLAIGLSYYKTDDTPVWRGGTNKKPFVAINEWQTFSLTFKPDADTRAICYCFTVNGTSGGTETATIRHCKLERGTIATSWSLHPKEWSNYIYGQYRDSSGYNQNAYIHNVSFISGQSPRYNVMADFSWEGYLSSTELSTSKGNTIAFWCSASDWSEYSLAGGICQGSNWNITSYNNNLILKLVSHISAENSDYNLSQVYNWTLMPTSSLGADWHYFVLTYLNHEIKFYLDGILYKTINNISTDIADYFYTNYLSLASLPVS